MGRREREEREKGERDRRERGERERRERGERERRERERRERGEREERDIVYAMGAFNIVPLMHSSCNQVELIPVAIRSSSFQL